MAERHEAEAAHQRPGGVDEGPDQDLDQQMQEIRRGDRRQRDQNREPDERQDADWGHRVNNPRGLTNMRMMKSVKAST